MAEREPKAGVDELLWPVRGVSADVTNLTKLDADGNVLTSSTDVAAQFVKKTGDTMTGNLIVERDGLAGGNSLALTVFTDSGTNPVINFRKTKGTKAAQTPLSVNDIIGRINFNTINAAGANAPVGFIGSYCSQSPTAAGVGSGLQFAVTRLRASDGVLENASMFYDHTGNLSVDRVTAGTVRTNAIDGAGGIVQLTGRLDATGTTAGAVIATCQSGPALSAVTTGGNAASTVRGLSVNMSGVSQITVGVDISNTGEGTDVNYGVRVLAMPDGPNNFAFYSAPTAHSYFRGRVGLNWFTPTHQLEVGGDTMLRGPLEVVGNITSTGTAHSFASRSIPSSAVIGSTAGTVAGGLAAGAAGTMIWDENFLYLKTATAWKKIPLTAI